MPGATQSRRLREAKLLLPPPRERRRQASPKVLLAVGGLAVAVVVAVVLAVALSSGSSKGGSASVALPNATDVQALFEGIPQSGNVLGSPAAGVTLVEYLDLQCPFCREFETTVLPDLVTKYVRSGRVKIELRTLAFIGPDSERGRAAVLAAAGQNRMFNLVELLYFNQGTENTGWLGDSIVASAAASIPGLDTPRFTSDKDSPTLAPKERAIDAEAKAAGIDSTPTILVGKTGGTLSRVTMLAPNDEPSVVAAIEAAA